MTLEQFVTAFASKFEDANIKDFTADTDFKKMDGWDSLTSVSISSMIAKEFGVRLLGGDLRGAKSIREVFDIVQQRIK